MSGLFIEESDKFDVVLFYKDEKDNIQILEKEEPNCKKLTLTFKHPDFSTSQKIIQSSVTILESGPVVDPLRLRFNLIYFLACGWDFKDKEGKDIEFSFEMFSKLRPSIAAYFIAKLNEKIGSVISV